MNYQRRLFCQPTGSLQQLFEKQARPHLAKKQMLFHCDNARVEVVGYELLLLPHNFRDLVTSDFLRKEILLNNSLFRKLDKSHNLEGVKILEKRWTKCVDFKNLCLIQMATKILTHPRKSERSSDSFNLSYIFLCIYIIKRKFMAKQVPFYTL